MRSILKDVNFGLNGYWYDLQLSTSTTMTDSHWGVVYLLFIYLIIWLLGERIWIFPLETPGATSTSIGLFVITFFLLWRLKKIKKKKKSLT